MIKVLAVGHACLDFVHGVTDHLTPAMKLDSLFSKIQLGGSAPNVAVALKALGANATVCTVLGNKHDTATQLFETLLSKEGIDLACNYVDSATTATSLITVLPNGDRSITCYQADEVIKSSAVDLDINDYDIVLGDNYRLPLVAKMFALAESRSIPTMLDVDKLVSKTDILPFADYVWFCQEAWQNFDNPIYVAYQQQVQKGIIGVTNGADPVTWLEPNSSVFQSVKPKPVDVVNSLGAGDVFRASLALQLCMNTPLAAAIERACESAGEHISGKILTKII